MGGRILSFLFPAGSWGAVFQYLSKNELIRNTAGTVLPDTFGEMLLMGCAWAFALVCFWPLTRIVRAVWAYRAGRSAEFPGDPKGPLENTMFGVKLFSLLACGSTSLAWFFSRVCAANLTAGPDYLSFADTFFPLALGFAVLAAAAHALLVSVRKRRRPAGPAETGGDQDGQ